MYIGICGKQGSGKSTLSKYLLDNLDNYICIDIDKIGHLINNLDNVKEELITVFGDSILINNQIDRKTLGKIVFNNKDKMKLLEDITWKYMEEEIDKVINDNPKKIIILDYILLPETKYFMESSIKILLNPPDEERKNRIIARDQISEEDYLLRNQARYDYNENDFDFIIYNVSDRAIERIINRIKRIIFFYLFFSCL